MAGYTIPFVLALAAFAAVFLAIDIAIMNIQGLSLIYQP